MLGSARRAPRTPSPMLRGVILVAASLHILLASGEAFGWTALRPMLYRTGFFDSYDKVRRGRRRTPPTNNVARVLASQVEAVFFGTISTVCK